MANLSLAILISLIIFLGIGFLGAPGQVHAAKCEKGEVQLSVPIMGEECVSGSKDDFSKTLIVTYMRWLLRFAALGFGLVMTVMLSIGGVQYITAQDNPQAIQAAKKKIFNAIISLVLFIFAFAIINYLIPGGLIGS